MKSVGLVGIVMVAGCMSAEPSPQVSTTSSALTDATMTEPWSSTDKRTDADKVAALWPSGATTAQIIYRQGPPIGQLTNTSVQVPGQKAFLAFVVWNHSVVGHVYWVAIGPDGADLKNMWDKAFSQRTNVQSGPAFLDHWGGGTGGGGVGTPPTPHPNVDGFPISATWNQAAKDAAAAIDSADLQFAQYAE